MDYLQSVTSAISAILLIIQLSVNICNTDWFQEHHFEWEELKSRWRKEEEFSTFKFAKFGHKEEKNYIFHKQDYVESFLLPIAQMREKPANEEKFAEIVQLCNSEIRF